MEESAGDEETTKEYGYSSDSDLEDDEEEMVTSLNWAGKAKAQKSNSFAIPGEDETFCQEWGERVDKDIVTKIPDMSFVT